MLYSLLALAVAFLIYSINKKGQIEGLMNYLKLGKDVRGLDSTLNKDEGLKESEAQKREILTKKLEDDKKKVENEDTKKVVDFFNNHK